MLAQLPNTDSLKRLIATTKNDTVKIAAYETLVWKATWSDPIQALQLAKEELLWARKSNLVFAEEAALSSNAVVLSVLGDYRQAIDYYLQSIRQCERLGLTKSLPMVFLNISESYSDAGDFDKAILYAYKGKSMIDTANYPAREKAFRNMLALTYIGEVYEKFGKLETDRQKGKAEQTLEELRNTQSQLIQSEKMASLGELTAGIAHEIQNPLNFVNNFSEVNRELIDEMQQELDHGNLNGAKAISNDIKENESKINHHGKRADAIVKGMLQHSRTSTGTKEPVNINAITEECLRLSYHGYLAKDKGFPARLETNFDNQIEKFPLIQQDIVRVLVNIFNNAFYAMTE